MNNTKFLTAALCITAGSLFTACQHDELEKTPAGNENLRTYHITVEAAAAPTVAGSTKALGIRQRQSQGADIDMARRRQNDSICSGRQYRQHTGRLQHD